MKTLKLFAPMALTVWFLGCAHTVMMSQNILPANSYATKLKGSYAVIVPVDLQNFEQRVSPSSYEGSAHYYTFKVGPSARSAVVNGVSAAVENAVIVATPPTAQVMQESSFAGYFMPQISNCAIDVNFSSGFLTTNAHASANISITLKYFDSNERNVFSYTATGSGFSSRGSDAFTAEAGFAEAVNMALRQISDAIAQAIYSSPDIRQSAVHPDSTK